MLLITDLRVGRVPKFTLICRVRRLSRLFSWLHLEWSDVISRHYNMFQFFVCFFNVSPVGVMCLYYTNPWADVW